MMVEKADTAPAAMACISARPLTATSFSRYGDVLETDGDPDTLINQGNCGRWHDLARLDFGTGRGGISIFSARSCMLPYRLEMLERHPLGSQAFIAMAGSAFLVIVAADAAGRPVDIEAFIAAPGQGVNLLANTWHGVLTPLAEQADSPLPMAMFAVMDRVAGEGSNLEEYWLETPLLVTAG